MIKRRRGWEPRPWALAENGGLLGQYKKEAVWVDAIIEDSYVKQDGVWKIASRRYYLTLKRLIKAVGQH